MKVSVLASGSSGNATYVESGTTRILFDCGLSGKYVENALNSIGRSAKFLDAMVVSHEHRDHISGVGILSRRYNIPVFANKKTFDSMLPITGKLSSFSLFDDDFRIRNLNISPVKTSHDASSPRAFIIDDKGSRFGVITDLGIVNKRISNIMAGLDGASLEFNHDPEMLVNGPYPEYLKQRIASEKGHLSNFQAANLVCEKASDKLKQVFLSHLSRTNNTPDLAYATFLGTVSYRPDLKVNVDVSSPFSPTKLRDIS